MRAVLLGLLLPLSLWAQEGFGPLRLDDSLAVNYYYPGFAPVDAGGVLCAWGSLSPSRLGAYGQRVQADGTWTGPRVIYEETAPGQIVCPAEVKIVPLTGGGEARLLNYS